MKLALVLAIGVSAEFSDYDDDACLTGDDCTDYQACAITSLTGDASSPEWTQDEQDYNDENFPQGRCAAGYECYSLSSESTEGAWTTNIDCEWGTQGNCATNADCPQS